MQLPFASLPVLEKLDSSLEGGTKVMIQHCLMGDYRRLTSKRMLQKVFDVTHGMSRQWSSWFLRPRFLDKLLAATFGGMRRH